MKRWIKLVKIAKAFCSKDITRPHLQRPYCRDNRIYATDGHRMIVIKSELPQGAVEIVDNNFIAIVTDTLSPFPNCSGIKTELDMCERYEFTVPLWFATLKNKEIITMKIGPSFFDARLFAPMAGEKIVCWVSAKDIKGPMTFCFENTDTPYDDALAYGVIMPILEHDHVDINLKCVLQSNW